MPNLPPPTVDVTTNGDKTHVVVSRPRVDGSPVGRSYEVEGTAENERIKNVVEKILADPYSAEWIPRR